MVTEYGMSAKLGAVKYGHGDDEPFLGRTYGSGPEYSIEVGSEIDGEVRALIETAHTEAWAVLNTYRDVLDALAGALLEKETLERRDLEVIFAEVEKRPRITAFDEFGPRLPSDRPPIKTPGELAIERGEPWPPVQPELTKPGPERPVPVGVAADYPGQAGYNTPKPEPQRSATQSPPNWTGGVLPGPLAPYDPGPYGRPSNGNQPAGPAPNGSSYGGPPNGHGHGTWGQPTGPVDPQDPWAPPRDRQS
jgi:cell division protease FtsH